MHRCLQIQEVIVNIFDYLTEDTSHKYTLGSNPTAALARLARTCRTFSGLALDVLWYSQSSLFPLIKCFPSNMLAVNKKGNYLRFNRAPTIEDYKRVIFYAPRIKELQGSIGLNGTVDVVVYSALLVSQRQWDLGPLLPQLQHLQINLDDFFGQAVFARLVSGPNLRTITTMDGSTDSLDNAEECWKNVSAVLAECASNLRRFEYVSFMDWSFRYESPLAAMTIFHYFHSLQSLRVVNLDITHDVLPHIATMPDLVELAFRIESKELGNFTETPLFPEEFSKLISLEIYSDNLSECTALLLRSSFRCLQKLTVVQCVEGGDWELQPFIANLSMPVLQVLRLWRLEEDDIVELAPITFTSSMLSFLLKLSRLTHLQITFNLSLQLRDADLKAMSAAWPRLVQLCLEDNALRNQPELTFQGCLSLASNCKDLRILRIRLDATKIPAFSSTGPIVPSQLESLHLCTSTISGWYDNVLEIIPLIFLKLRKLDVSGLYVYKHKRLPLPPTERENADAWRGVIEGLRPFVPS